jgi:ArsR family transcriptional regulator
MYPTAHPMASILNSLRLIADETRLRLLLLLQKEELSVVELQEVLGMGQSRISSHLAQLRRAGLLQDRRAGKNIYYALAQDPVLKELAPIISAGAGEIPETQRDAKALALLLRNRQDMAREYFNELAGKFGRTYCPGRTWNGLAHMLLLLVPECTIADLGAGEGTLAQLLAKRAKRVIAVDNSEKMVEFGEDLAKKHGIKNLDYRLGDIEEPPIEPAVAAAYRILKPGGRLAVLDLLQHQFEKARELYADIWLGFTEADLHHFLEDAGFRSVEVSVVARDDQNPQFQTLLATGVKP